MDINFKCSGINNIENETGKFVIIQFKTEDTKIANGSFQIRLTPEQALEKKITLGIVKTLTL